MPIYMIATLFTQFAAPTVGKPCTETTFFGLIPWYHYLQTAYYQDPTKPSGQLSCDVKFNPLPSSGQSDFLLVLLAIVDDLLRLAGILAIGFVVWGGVTYITSQGSPEQTQRAQQTIQNAIIGLVLCVLAIGLVSFIGTTLTK